jgi:hypothetical protein
MPIYDGPQQLRGADPKVIAGFHRAADERNASDYVRLALFEAGIVEANLKNPAGGDRDSVGALQQRSGWGSLTARMDPYRAAQAFLSDLLGRVLPKHPNARAGELAQLVQRSAYPDRYNAAEKAAAYVISQTKGNTVSWFLAPSLKKLFADVDAKWPHRSKAWDGSIGDASHAARKSEHNPNRDTHDAVPDGAVTAIDITSADIDAPWVIKHLINDPRVWYVIHDGTIWSRTYKFAARKYTGANSHTHHIHVSLNQNKQAVNDVEDWFSTAPAPAPHPAIVPLDKRVKPGANAAQVKLLQQMLITAGYGPIKGAYTTTYGTATQAAVVRFHKKNPQFASSAKDPAIGPKGFAELQREAYSK